MTLSSAICHRTGAMSRAKRTAKWNQNDRPAKSAARTWRQTVKSDSNISLTRAGKRTVGEYQHELEVEADGAVVEVRSADGGQVVVDEDDLVVHKAGKEAVET